jgi:hypothetical protein
MEETFDMYIDYYVRKSRDANLIKDYKSKYKPPLSELSSGVIQIVDFFKEFKAIYERGNGFEMNWVDSSGEITGKLEFLSADDIIRDWKKTLLIDDDDIEENYDIQYFHPFDLLAPEAQCGFVITPEKVYDSVYYHDAGESELHSLDLDFNGYCEMAVEARIFSYWQRVLLFLQGDSIGEARTQLFKEYMPTIFPDFSWENFVSKYEGLRLSNKK